MDNQDMMAIVGMILCASFVSFLVGALYTDEQVYKHKIECTNKKELKQ